MILIALAAAAMTDMRRADVEVRSTLPLIGIQSCITRYWSQAGTVMPIPLADGVTMDLNFKVGIFGSMGKSPLSIEIHDLGADRSLTITYRHPWSEKKAVKFFHGIEKRCFPAA